MGSESRTLVPPNRTNRSSPGSFDRVIPQSGRFRMPPPESLRSWGLLCSERDGLSRSLGAFLGASLPPSGADVSYLGAVWCMGGVFAVPVRMVWLLVFAKICCGCLPPGDCNFSCTQIGYNPSCLDARSLTLPRYCPGVGRMGTYVPTAQTSLPATPSQTDPSSRHLQDH